MVQFKCTLYADVVGSSRTLYRDAVLPIPPFIGLVIGLDRIVEVFVSQDGDSDEIECHLEPVEGCVAECRLDEGGWSEL